MFKVVFRGRIWLGDCIKFDKDMSITVDNIRFSRDVLDSVYIACDYLMPKESYSKTIPCIICPAAMEDVIAIEDLECPDVFIDVKASIKALELAYCLPF